MGKENARIFLFFAREWVFLHFKALLYLMNKILSLLLWLLLPGVGVAQTAVPTARPTMIVVQTDGTESETTAYDGSAPLTIRLEARPQNLGSRTARYEWRFVADGSTTPVLVRYDETTSYVFAQSGSYSVRLLASFVEGRDTIAYEQEEPFRIAIAESRSAQCLHAQRRRSERCVPCQRGLPEPGVVSRPRGESRWQESGRMDRSRRRLGRTPSGR